MEHYRNGAAALFAASFMFWAACGGDGTPTGIDDDGNGGGGGNGVTRSIKSDPSLSDDIWEIFVRNGCSSAGCHGGGAGGMTLDQVANVHGNLVNVSGDNGETLVIPGSADQSYLMKRVDGRVTPQMPLNRAPLDDIDLTNLRNWINQGAKNN